MEGAGEDPYLGSRIAEARVKDFKERTDGNPCRMSQRFWLA